MNPSIIVSIAGVAAVLGAVGFSYHVGRSQEYTICQNDKLVAELTKAKKELKFTEELSAFQQDQIGEAHSKVDKEVKLNAELKAKLASIPLDRQPDCVPSSVLDNIREFRRKSKDKNS